MSIFVLYLNNNGNNFSCKTFKDGPLKNQILDIKSRPESSSLITSFIGFSKSGENFFLEFSSALAKDPVKYQIDSDVVPESIKQALSCKNRKEVESYINQLLRKSKSGSKKNHYLIKDVNEMDIEIGLYHLHFYEKEPGLNNHSSIKGAAHAETANEMLEFVRNRSSFFLKNYKIGQNYQNTSWINPFWILTCLNYYAEAFKNSLAHTFIGSFILGLKPTSFCEDFNLGCKSSIDLNTNEVNVSLA